MAVFQHIIEETHARKIAAFATTFYISKKKKKAAIFFVRKKLITTSAASVYLLKLVCFISGTQGEPWGYMIFFWPLSLNTKKICWRYNNTFAKICENISEWYDGLTFLWHLAHVGVWIFRLAYIISSVCWKLAIILFVNKNLKWLITHISESWRINMHTNIV